MIKISYCYSGWLIFNGWQDEGINVYIRRCDEASESERSMRNGSGRVCVWYQCQGVCFFAQPAVSLNNHTYLVPPVIHSLSGNLQYHREIKRSIGGKEEGMMKRYERERSARGGRRIPLISLLADYYGWTTRPAALTRCCTEVCWRSMLGNMGSSAGFSASPTSKQLARKYFQTGKPTPMIYVREDI